MALGLAHPARGIGLWRLTQLLFALLVIANGWSTRKVFASTPADSALISAVEIGNLESVKVLLEAGASPDASDEPLHEPALCVAIRMKVNHVEDIVKALLARKPDLSVMCALGDTALTLAVQQKLPNVVKALKAAGANPNEVGMFGETANALAQQSPDSVMISALGLKSRDVSCRRKAPKLLSQSSLPILESPVVAFINSFAFDHNAQLILLGGSDGSASIWDTISGRKILSISAHRRSVDTVQFKGDNSQFFSASTTEGTARLWTLPFGAQSLEIAGLHPSSWVPVPAFIGADWHRITALSDPKTLVTFSITDCSEIARVTMPLDIRLIASVGMDARRIAIATTDGKVSIWDVTSKFPGIALAHPETRVTAMASTKRGDLLAVGTTTKEGPEMEVTKLEIWQIAEPPILIRSLPWQAEARRSIGTLAFSDSGRSLFVGDGNSYRVLDTQSFVFKAESKEAVTGSRTSSLSLEGCFFSGDGDILSSVGHGPNEAACPTFRLRAFDMAESEPMFSIDPRALFVRSGNRLLKWSFDDGRPLDLTPPLGTADIASAAANVERSSVFVGDSAGNVTEIDASGDVLRKKHLTDCSVTALAFSDDKIFAALGRDWSGRCDSDNLLGVYSMDRFDSTQAPLKLADRGASKVIFDKATSFLFTVGDFNRGVTQWDLSSGAEKPLPLAAQPSALDASSVAVIPGDRLALGLTSTGLDQTMSGAAIVDSKGVRALSLLAEPERDAIADVILRSNRKELLGAGQRGEVYSWNVDTGEIDSVLVDSGNIVRLALNGDQSMVATGLSDGTVTLWDLETRTTRARISTFGDLDNSYWLVTTPDGRYDSNSPGDLPGASWILPSSPLSPLPIESYIKEYYEPGLLAKSLRGEKLPPIRALQSLDRDAPSVRIVDVRADKDATNVTVSVEVTEPNWGSPASKSDNHSALDLRVFRDGQLVGYAPTESGIIVTTQGLAHLEFPGIKLPTDPNRWDRKRSKDLAGRKAEFSAYAFNKDWVKSQTARFDYFGSVDTPPRSRRAFVIAIGMNEYENRAWNLTYAADDACATVEVVGRALESSGRYASVARIPLISGTCTGSPAASRTIINRELIHNVFELMAGRKIAEETLGRIPLLNQLSGVTPDDVVVISYSGHGFADNKGDFFLFPYDIGPGSARRELDTHRLISNVDLSNWLRDVDAGSMTMIIDACQSAASVQGPGFRPGPMGSRGLGQLAYDKGMRILAASQAESVALESAQLRHGVLSYALLIEGIEQRQALHLSAGNQVAEGSWLRYGVERVPKLYEELKSRRFAGNNRGFHRRDVKSSEQSRDVQKPVLFDFRPPGLSDPVLVLNHK